MPPYFDTTLDPSRAEIRLLEFTSTTPTITCKLLTVSLNENPTFSALSYVWGDAALSHTIVVNGTSARITESLAAAITIALKHWTIAFPDRDPATCRLWADGICIDQSNNDEKSQQVLLMTRIYSSSEITLCCLDTTTSDSDIRYLLGFCAIIGQHIVESGFESRAALLDGWDKTSSVDWMGRIPLVSIGRAPYRDNSFDLFDYSVDHPVAHAITNFCCLEYFQRAWIFHELVVSKKPILIHPSGSIFLLDLLEVAAWCFWATRQHAKPSGVHPSVWKRMSSMFRGSNLVKIDDYRHSLLLRQRLSTTDNHLVRWAQVMATVSAGLKASNPKDHVFALLGITGLCIEPDYSARTSLASVYIQFSTEYMRAVLGPPVLDCPVDPLELLDYAGLANQDDTSQTEALPSWVPNFHGCSLNARGYKIYAYPTLVQHNRPMWVDYSHFSSKIFIQDHSLHVPAIFVASLTEFSTALTMFADSRPDFISSILGMIKNERMATREDTRPVLSLAGALSKGPISKAIWESQEVEFLVYVLKSCFQSCSERELETVLGPASSGTDPAGFARELRLLEQLGILWTSTLQTETGQASQADVELWVTDLYHYLWGVPSVIGEICRLLPTASSFLKKFILRETLQDPEYMNSLIEDIRLLCTGDLRFSRTSPSGFAVVPPQAAKGDFIVLLAGDSEFRIIREVGGHYIYVGPCGIETELSSVRDQLQSGEVVAEMIELR